MVVIWSDRESTEREKFEFGQSPRMNELYGLDFIIRKMKVGEGLKI